MQGIVITETSRSGYRSMVENAATHMYSHMMKCMFHKNISPKWVGTIFEGNKNINEAYIKRRSSITDVMNDPRTLDDIRKSAIDEYYRDDKRNRDGEIMFNIVYNDFPTILDLKDKEKVRSYLINRATKIGDDKAIELIMSK